MINGTQTNADCVETGTFARRHHQLAIGTLPPGSEIGYMYQDVKINGQGCGQSLLDGAGLYRAWR
jgi:hypothetical protein